MNKTGCLIRPSNTRNYIFPSSAEDVTLPTEYILPDDRIPTVRDQGDTNSCVGHGLAEAMGVLYGVEFGNEKLLSPWYIYGNKECRKGYTGLGMFLSDAVDGVRKCGTVPLPDFDVRKEPPDIIDAVSKRPELAEAARPYKIKGYVQIPKYAMSNKFTGELKRALYTYKTPIVIASGKYFGGGHCVVLIGWNKNNNFIFLNSWGNGYGDHGKSTIPPMYIDEAYVLLDEDLILPFTDVQAGDWYYKDIKAAYLSGIVRGNGGTQNTFDPDNPITRGEAAAIVFRVLEKAQAGVDAYMRSVQQYGGRINTIDIEPPLISNVTCPDVIYGAWYYDCVTRLLSTGIMTGDSEGTFRPDDNITRAEAAAVAVRLHEYVAAKLNIKVSKPYVTKTFSDVRGSDWFYKAVGAAIGYGLIEGDSEGTFRPNDNITRAEFTAVIVRNMKKIDDMFIQMCRV